MIVTTAITLAGLTFAAKNLKDLGVVGFTKGVMTGVKQGLEEQATKKRTEQEERIATSVVKGLLANSDDAGKQAILKALNNAEASEKAA